MRLYDLNVFGNVGRFHLLVLTVAVGCMALCCAGPTVIAQGQTSLGNEVTFQNPAVQNPALNPLPSTLSNSPSPTEAAPTATSEARYEDTVLGLRIAKVSREMEKIPNEHDQLWREFDISPYTKGRTFPAGVKPEQTIVDWIIRQTGLKTWHSDVFSIITADSEKLYVYHTKEVLMVVADIVDRFVTTQFLNDSCKIRAVSLSRPDWIARNHAYLRPIPIVSPGIQGWILEPEGSQLLLQDLARRTDFKEIAQPQFLIPNGIAHNVVSKKQRTYLRDIQLNSTALNGYAEDRVTMEEGFGISFVPLCLLDGQGIDATIKLDIVQVEKMIPLMIDAPTTTNPRQRVQVESPQVACFKMDEQIRWPKNKILLLDLGTIPMPNNAAQAETQNFLTDIAKSFKNVQRANILLFIECTSTASPVTVPTLVQPAVSGADPAGAISPGTQSIGTNSGYWQGIR